MQISCDWDEITNMDEKLGVFIHIHHIFSDSIFLQWISLFRICHGFMMLQNQFQDTSGKHIHKYKLIIF